MTTIIGDGLPAIRLRQRIHRRRRVRRRIRLTSFDDAYCALGEWEKISALTGKSRSCIWNWRRLQQFPAKYYRVMRDALSEEGYVADMRLWDFVDQHDDEKSALTDVAA
jgi:hypothetical protein